VLQRFSPSLLPQEIYAVENRHIKKLLVPSSDVKRKTIIFYEDTLGCRGTTQAMFDYAYHARELLDMNVFIAYSPRASDERAIAKFAAEFPIAAIHNQEDIQCLIDNTKADYFYDIEFGAMQGWQLKNVKYLVHSVFCSDATHKHGDVYAVVSEAQSKKGGLPWVPHMISLPKVDTDLRAELGIPTTAKVLGRHGGPDTFDVQFVKDAIPDILNLFPDVWFLFMNTDKFIDHPRVIHIDSTVDPVRKAKFIKSCNAMLHARSYGETFGLACLEFAHFGLPVYTFVDHKAMQEHPLGGSSHLDILGDESIQYFDRQGLLWAMAVVGDSLVPKYPKLHLYRPEAVMQKFKEVFLD
jgi:hypothetical protein